MRPTVFLIDDDEDILEFYQSVFQSDGAKFEVKAYNRAEKAIEALQVDGLPDVFLVDIMMPGIDGIEFIEILRERGMRRPVIVVSGYAQKEHAIRALNAGAFAMLEKPVSPALILNVTQRAAAFQCAMATAETLLGCQSELIANLDRIKDNYEERLIDLENQMVEHKGKLTHTGKSGLDVLVQLKEDRMLNTTISAARQQLESIKERFVVTNIWR